MGGERDAPPPGGEAREADGPSVPFPGSLCHRCAAPPQYIRTARSIFIRCPILKKYPPQPVSRCEAFVPIPGSEPSSP